jgi:cell wall-associated NlpC family hydrolase
MSTPFFDTPEREDLLAASLRKWEGTPFRQHAAVPKVGVDCVRFAREVYRECGVDVGPAEDIPRYSLAWGIHQDQSQVLAWLLTCQEARAMLGRVDVDDPWMAGDLIAVRRSQSVHHVGIAGPGANEIWHVDIPSGVSRIAATAVREHLQVVSVFRLRE